MHLWPSTMIRDSFKLDYLRRLEWNLQRMNSQKASSSSVNQKLLDTQNGASGNEEVPEVPNSKDHMQILLSYCFCCGAFGDHVEN
ncbi:hypothetical protein RchiOBHm_Chr1g0363411 [Rosa chinensis]|uniref:Uncharacterized protein n=1 Tax=Rosa chinensis TaxID=74649 RepID=A0A2P6SJG7_ROSCH|nr:hypothetical protein RchiOBHm_Chr1g0363411 [Rosa chinensis]